MYFAIICIDEPGSHALRMAVRETHRAYLHGPHDYVTLRIAGPLTTDDGQSMIGSLIVVEAETRDRVAAFSAADPYAQAGLFRSVDIRRWNWTTGNPAGAT